MEWRVVVGFPQYEVSEFGDVRRAVSSRTRKAGSRLRGTIDLDGYLRYKLVGDDSRDYVLPAHVAVAEAWLGARPTPAHEVRHLNGSRVAHHYSNLEWATRAENHADIQIHGTAVKGERNGRAIISEAEARDIFRLRGSEPASRVARRMGLPYSVVVNLWSRRTWKHIHG